MDKVIRILISLSVVFISFLFIYEGKTILLTGNKLLIHNNHDQNCDLKIPFQQDLDKSQDEDIWINSNSFELSFSSEMPSLFHFYQNNKTKDFTIFIWQPPKPA